MGLSEEIKAEIDSQFETLKEELKKELQSLFNQRTTDTINGVEEKYKIMSSGMTVALSDATIKFDAAAKLISGVTAIKNLVEYGATVDNMQNILDNNRKAFSGFTQSATTLFKKLQEDVGSGFTFAISSVSGIIRTSIESGLSETFLKKTALSSAITEANVQLFNQSKEYTNGIFANASAFTLSKFNDVSNNLGVLSGDVRGLASGFTGLNNQFTFYTPTSAMSGFVLNIATDKFVKQDDFGPSVSGIVENVVGNKFADASAFTISKFNEVSGNVNVLQNSFNNFQNTTEGKWGEIDRKFATFSPDSNGQMTGFTKQFEAIESALSRHDEAISGVNSKFEGIDGDFTNINNQINGFNGKFNNIDSKFEGIDEQIADHGTNIGNLDKQLKSFGTTVESITGKVSTFESKVTGFETSVGSFNNRFSAIEGNVSGLTNNFNDMNGKVSTLEGGVNSLNTDLTEVRSQFSSYTPTTGMSAIVLNITKDKYVEQDSFDDGVNGIVESFINERGLVTESYVEGLITEDKLGSLIDNYIQKSTGFTAVVQKAVSGVVTSDYIGGLGFATSGEVRDMYAHFTGEIGEVKQIVKWPTTGLPQMP